MASRDVPKCHCWADRCAAAGCEAIFTLPNDNLTFLLRKEITAAARQHRIATMLGSHEIVRDGGLIAYAPSNHALFRRASYFVDRMLRGSQPGELPFEQPTRYDLVINLATARALGITIPERVLSTAAEVIDQDDRIDRQPRLQSRAAMAISIVVPTGPL